MASREEEKRRRREEREAAERAEREREARTKRVRMFGGIGLIVVGVAAAVIAIVVGGGSGSSAKKPTSRPAITGTAIPAQKTSDLAQAAANARCTVHSYHWTQGDRDHVADGTKVKYRTNPPSYGDHYQTPASDGDYVGQGTPPTGNLVHALEHGRVEIQYRPGLPAKDVAQLEKFFQDDKAGKFTPGQYLLIFANKTSMPYQIAATSWGRDMVCPNFNQGVFDALRAFRVKYSQQAPEKSFLAPE
jgi:hypothetical protein